MKLHQNKLDRFSVIAKKLVDDRSAELHKDIMHHSADEVYNNHLNTLGKQLDNYAQDFLNNCKIQNEQFRKEVWGTCNKYLDLFARINEPGEHRFA